MKDPQLCLVRNKVAGHTCIDENSKRWLGKRPLVWRRNLKRWWCELRKQERFRKIFWVCPKNGAINYGAKQTCKVSPTDASGCSSGGCVWEDRYLEDHWGRELKRRLLELKTQEKAQMNQKMLWIFFSKCLELKWRSSCRSHLFIRSGSCPLPLQSFGWITSFQTKDPHWNCNNPFGCRWEHSAWSKRISWDSGYKYLGFKWGGQRSCNNGSVRWKKKSSRDEQKT